MAPLKHIRVKTDLIVEAPTSGQDIEYPSDFFREKKKPSLTIPTVFLTMEKARDVFASSLVSSKPDLDAGKEFVYRFLSEITQVNTERWVSYGVPIADPDTEVTVFDLFEVSLKNVDASSSAKMDVSYAGGEIGLLVMFCGIYRLAGITDNSYQTQVSDRVMSQAVGIPGSVPRPATVAALVGTWISDLNYLKLIAGIDMYIHRFTKCPFAQARVGTISSRYRDCASLLSIRYFLNMIGTKDLDQAGAWITYEPIALDLIQMSKTGEEAGVGAK